MRILHTSDWHLGKKLYRESRIDEQKLFLEWLLTEIEDQKIDVLIIAGDIFDVPNPPNDAHKLYNDFLNQAQALCHSIIIISGNHDSGDFLRATQTFTREKNIYIFDKLQPNKKDNQLTLSIANTSVDFSLLPYFRNIDLFQYYQNEFSLNESDSKNEKPENWRMQVLEHALSPKKSKNKKIAISHHAFGNYSATGSEHTLSLSGMEHLSLALFKDHDYVALGHIHQYQKLSENPLSYYTGSPIPMRFSERRNKFYNIIHINDENELSVEKREIPIFREIIQINTDSNKYLEDIKNHLSDLNSPLIAFVEVKIKMLTTLAGMNETIKELCEKYQTKLLNIIPLLEVQKDESEKIIDIHDLSATELFEIYYKEKYPEATLTKNLKNKFHDLLKEIQDEDS